MKNEKLIVEIDLNGNVCDQIIALCESKGLILNVVCREAGIDRSILTKWKVKNPKTINILASLFSVLGNKTATIDEPIPEPIESVGIEPSLEIESDNWL